MLTDVSPQVEELLTAAAPALATSGAKFLTPKWMQEVADSSPRTADLVAEAVSGAGGGYAARGLPTVPATVGCFPLDQALLSNLLTPSRRPDQAPPTPFFSIPDHILLWRMLAHGDTDLARELVELVPELAEPRKVITARPSDLELLTGKRGAFNLTRPADVFGFAQRLGCDPTSLAERRGLFGGPCLVIPDSRSSDDWDTSDMAWLNKPYERHRSHATIGDLLEISKELGVNVTQAAARLRSYGITVVPDELSDGLPDEVDLQLLHRNGEVAKHDGIWDQGPVPPGHVAQAALRTGLKPGEVQRRIERYGLPVEPFDFPERVDQVYVDRLSQDHDGRWPWVSAVGPLPPWQLVAAQDWSGLSANDVRAGYRRLGFTLPPQAAVRRESPDDFELLAGRWEVDWSPFRTDRAPSFHQLVAVAENLGLSLRTLTSRLADFRVRTGMVLPQRTAQLDRELFRYDDLLQVGPDEADERDVPWWFWLSPDDEIPFFVLVLAARSLSRRPRELATRLRSYGLRVSRCDLPRDLTHLDALRLLTADGHPLPKPMDPPMPLAQLVRITRRVDLPLADTARHLRDPGVHVNDLAVTVRAALAQVPSG
ncbi:hypothetical protein ABWJ92_05120 [Streptomyces sp. NPDC000609]|uniref:wHTH domain-containing protein n=1 Tax=Streptomyces sp. NPDC000609 TaxID=3160957 RepID=UPI0033934BA7